MEESSSLVTQTDFNYFRSERVEAEYQAVLEGYMKKHREELGRTEENAPNIYEYLQSKSSNVGRYAKGLNYENLLYLLRECDLTIEQMYQVLDLPLPALDDGVENIYRTCARLSEEGCKVLCDAANKMAPAWWRTNEEVVRLQHNPSGRLIHAEKRLYADKAQRTTEFESLISGVFPALEDGSENPVVRKAMIAWNDRHMVSSFGLPVIPYAAKFVGAPVHWAFNVELELTKNKEKARNSYYRKKNMPEIYTPNIPYRTDAPYIEEIIDAYGFMGQRSKAVFDRLLQTANDDLDAGFVPGRLVAEA